MYRKSFAALLFVALGIGANKAHAGCVTRTIEAHTVRVEYLAAELHQFYSQLINMEGAYTATGTATICHGLNKKRRARIAAAQQAANNLAYDITHLDAALLGLHTAFCAQLHYRYLAGGTMDFYAIAYTGLVSPDRKTSATFEVPLPRGCW